MKKLLLFLVAACALSAGKATAQDERPKLVVGLVVDQMRWDYLYFYRQQYGEGGLRRLIDEGFSCENTMIPYVPTVTAIGHSSVYTGSTPALHGICGNNFFIRGRQVYCCGDSTVRSVGSDSREGQMSPRLMLASTIGDELKLATDFRSRVVGVALKDRAAILPAGHSADAAYWWDQSAGRFVSSTFYMEQLPRWVEDFNKKNHTRPGFDLKTSDDGVSMTFRMAEAALENEQLGQRGETDMLCVSISSTDAIGHTFSTRGEENRSVYMRLDRELAHFLDVLDRKIGRNQYLLFLTADHGAAHNYNFLAEHRIPAGAWESWNSVPELRRHLAEVFHTDRQLVVGESSYRIYLDHEGIADAGLKLADVKAEAISWLRKDDRFQYVVDFERAAEATLPPLIRERLCNGYNPDRAGDIAVITRPQVFITTDKPDYRGTSHGAWNSYDAHIPCVFLGWHVAHGATSAPTAMTDIAPTVCQMLRIEMPNACIGQPITALTDARR
ncbi:MAG: alkaline phosphatase family protein [Prevotella sp.]|nr:alkaline phosphatase family protein [Prevotella sp.]